LELAGATIIFNFLGSSVKMGSFSLGFLNPYAATAVYNFPEATAINIYSISIQGLILAPNAAATMGGGTLEGLIVTGNW
jgi:choice-of-anchor A domain-containing protein